MEKNRLLSVIVLAISVGLIIGYYGYATTQSNPWDGLSCDEMIDYTQTPEHLELTMEEHMEFHKYYNPCTLEP